MSDTDQLVTDRLRTADVPALDSGSVIAAATTAGRQTVRVRRSATALASLAVVAVVGGLTATGLTPSAGPQPQVADTATPEPEVTETPEPVPYGGSWHSLIVEKVTDRTVGRIGPVEPIPTDAARGLETIDDLETQDHPYSRMTLDSIETTIRFTWGTEPITRDEMEFYRRTMSEEEFTRLELDSTDFADPMKQCRTHQTKEASGYEVSACTPGPDGSAWYTYTFLIPQDEEAGPQARRGAVVLHSNSWVQTIEQNDGKFGRQPQYDRMASPEELYRIVRDGAWFH